MKHLLTFEKVDELLYNFFPKDLNKVIYGYYSDNQCEDCKKDCNKCDFCVEQRQGQYFCKCCCTCSICWSDSWENWFENHFGQKLEESEEKDSALDLTSSLLDSIISNVITRSTTIISDSDSLDVD